MAFCPYDLLLNKVALLIVAKIEAGLVVKI
jgi:hypothetical protein